LSVIAAALPVTLPAPVGAVPRCFSPPAIEVLTLFWLTPFWVFWVASFWLPSLWFAGFWFTNFWLAVGPTLCRASAVGRRGATGRLSRFGVAKRVLGCGAATCGVRG